MWKRRVLYTPRIARIAQSSSGLHGVCWMEEGKVRLVCGSRKWKSAQSVKKAKAMKQMLKTRKANRPASAHTVLDPESASS